MRVSELPPVKFGPNAPEAAPTRASTARTSSGSGSRRPSSRSSGSSTTTTTGRGWGATSRCSCRWSSCWARTARTSSERRAEMNRMLVTLWSVGAILLGASSAQAKLNVVATTPDFGAVATAVGKDLVSVDVLAKATEDPHFVDARPSHVVKLNRADALIEGGAELEIGWLPPLVDGARNPKIATGAPGRIVASQGIALLDVPSSVDRSQGDIHALGNPHFMLDPMNAKLVATHIAESFCALDAAHCAAYRSNRD